MFVNSLQVGMVKARGCCRGEEAESTAENLGDHWTGQRKGFKQLCATQWRHGAASFAR